MPASPTPAIEPSAFDRTAGPTARAAATQRAATALRLAALSAATAIVAGQLVFAGYVALLYGRAALSGGYEAPNAVLPEGFIAGDVAGNLVLGLHLAFAFTITVGGALQLWPALRRRLPALHRWNGRAYLVAAAVLSSGGLVMIGTRETVGDASQHAAISVNALLILAFAAIAWRHARARRIDRHRRAALRLFLAVSGVWFFRVGLMFWLALHQAPVGFDPKSFTGPFLTVLGFAQYLVPLAVLELYFCAQRSRRASLQLATAAVLAVSTLVIGAGTAAAAAGLWLPRL